MARDDADSLAVLVDADEDAAAMGLDVWDEAAAEAVRVGPLSHHPRTRGPAWLAGMPSLSRGRLLRWPCVLARPSSC